MKKIYLIGGLFCVLLVVMAFMNPPKELHVQKITSVTRVHEQRSGDLMLDFTLEMLLDSYISYEIAYHKYWFISIANYDKNNGSSIKTLGILGNVIVI